MSNIDSAEKLIEIVNQHSKSTVLQAENCKIVICERGARILGIFLDTSPNILWVNPRLDETFLRGDWNVGGLRHWISPERNFFYRKPEEFEEWFCPEGIDPGEYKLIEVDSRKAVIEGRISAYDMLRKTQLKAEIHREIRLVEYTGEFVRIRILEVLVGEYSGNVSPWVLAQVPVGYDGVGTVLIPVKKGTMPIHYFVEIPKDRLKISNDCISFKIDGQYVSKIGVRPEDIRQPEVGIIAFVTKIGERLWSTLVLRSHDIPLTQEDCLDVAKRDPNLPRAAIQSYNSGPESFQDIKFGEIELQFSPTVNISNRIITRLEYDVISFIGGKNKVLAKTRRLLKIAKLGLYGVRQH